MLSPRVWRKVSQGLPLVVFLAGGSVFLAKVRTYARLIRPPSPSPTHPTPTTPAVTYAHLIRPPLSPLPSPTHPPTPTPSPQFVQGRVEAKDSRIHSSSEREFSIEEEHKQMMEKLKPDSNYKIVRIHRADDEA